MAEASNVTAPTQFVDTKLEKYAYRRFGTGSGLPLLCLQHFTGTLDNWDPAAIDPLASGREVMLFDNAVWGVPPERCRRHDNALPMSALGHKRTSYGTAG